MVRGGRGASSLGRHLNSARPPPLSANRVRQVSARGTERGSLVARLTIDEVESENAENLSNRRRDRAARPIELAELMRKAAEPAVPGELVVHAINRAARRLGITRRAAKGFWYTERRQVPSDLMDRARAIAAEPIVQRGQDEFRALADRIARLEAALRVSDPDFHSDQIDALGQLGRPDHRALGR